MAREKYTSHVKPHLEKIRELRGKGYTIKDICKEIGVGYSNFRKYVSKHKALRDVINDAKKELVENLKKSLFQEAMGYDYTEVKTIIEENPRFAGEPKNRIEKVTKRARGQSALLIFYLCNLAPDEFKRVDVEVVKELEDKIDEKFRLENNVFKNEFDRLFLNRKENNAKK